MDPRLKAQLRIEEIDGMLEELHLNLVAPIFASSPAARAMLLRCETDLRRERAALQAEIA